ncbi:MAG: hypothetical protein SangKO_066700 [Sandaracinaceae bacterium]
MATKVAPPKSTGGGGFVFEDDVCAWLIASMLVGEPVFGADCGAPVRLDFQTRPDGWFLDDVLVTTAVGATRHRFALSVKSNVQFTATSAPSDFVAAAWEQWLRLGSTAFDAARDFMGLVTTPLSGAAASSVSGLAEKARVNDPALFAVRIATPTWATDDQRSLFSGFACPASLGQATTDEDTAHLLQRLRFVQRDFGAAASESQNRALELCRRAVRGQNTVDAQTLWSILREVASELRPYAGSLTLSGLINRLRTRVLLAEYPDHAGDWSTLDSRSTREVGLVRDSIADRVRLSREGQVKAVIDSLKADEQVALLGPSGVGKSALAKAAVERRQNGQRTLWFDAAALDRAADFGAFETSLQLRHPLAELLGSEAGRDPLVVIDGLDRLYSEHSFRSVATLLRAVRGEQPATSWRVLAVCQSQEWPRVLEALQRAGAPITRWSIQEAKAPRLADLQPVRDAVPALGRLFLLPRVGNLLTNLKLLDLVVRRLVGGTKIDASTWVGESSVAEWFWGAEIDRGQDRLARGQFARVLAQAQADQLVAAVSVDSLEAGSLGAAQSLTADQLLVQAPGDRLAFAHDLYGDWARLRILLNHRANLAAFLEERYESPLWHRAIRLLGIHLLERANGVDEWKALMSSFASGDMGIVRDLLLEAPAFAMNAGTLLNRIFPDLASGDSALLRRLVTRFLAFATVPNEQMLEIARSIGMDLNAARAAYRRPHWPYWLDVLEVLHAHRDEALRVAPSEIARVAEMWLEFVPPGSVRRREVAELAVMLGQRALDTRNAYGGREAREDRKRFYKCALLAAPERPDEVTELVKIAAERVPRPVAEEVEAPRRPRSSSIFGPGVMRGPWPDGPLDRVDDAFKSVVLEGSSIQHLYQVRPAVACEVILATLLKAPYEDHWGSGGMHWHELELADDMYWQPSLFTRGPFLLCLRANFEEGLELVMRLVEFATEQSREYAIRKVNDWRARARADGRSEAEVTEAHGGFPPDHLTLHDGDQELSFVGDAGSFGWSAGITCPQGYSPLPPSAVASALMALEQYFYQRLDTGEAITEDLVMTLARCRSVAPLGVLVDVGKRQKDLFNGPLRTLLSAPEIYSWDISKAVHGRTHLMIGAFDQGQHFIDLARQFHGLEHRKRDLRHVATERLLKSEEMQTFFATVRDWWKQRRTAGESLPEMAEQLDHWLDPTNYEVRQDPTHGTVIVNVALERVQSENASEHQEMNDRMLVTSFPIRCRTLLDERQLQNDEQLEELWQAWERIREFSEAGPALPGGEERLGDEYANATTGGVAVFLWHGEWLGRHEERRRSIETAIETIVGTPPDRGGFASEQDVSTWTWDCFLAETAAMLWAREPEDARWRRLVAEMVFAKKYVAVRLLFSRCAEHRAVLGEDFERLRRLAVDWAHMRDRVDVLRGWQHMVPQDDEQARERLQDDVARWAEQAIASFVAGTLEQMPADWNRFSEASRFAEIDELRRRWPDSRVMDFHLVRCSHEWLPLPDETSSQEEREKVVEFWRVALDVVAARPRADLQRRDHQYPHEDEAWVLQSVAAVVLQLRPVESPELFWGAIVDLHSEAHDWPERFLNALHRHALSSEHTPATYGPLVRQIVQRAFSEVDGARRWPWHEEVWDALLGIDWWVRDVWAERHANHVASIWDVISLWMDKAPLEGRRLAKFARWLSTPAAGVVRLRTLPWFLERLRADEERSIYRDEDADDDLAKLLNVMWDRDQSRLRATPESFAAFRGLLAWLVDRQNSLGLEIQGRIGGLA